MALTEYKNKRRFNKTPEPEGGAPSSNALEFVVQKHAASHLHYDFRLQMQGVLKSWAVPKGPSMDSAIRRTAIQVEDHPYDYKNFEGNIPEGQYGGGSVIIWDKGTYEPSNKKNTKKEQERELIKQFYAGEIDFILKGKKLNGRFRLKKMQERGDDNWILTKVKDEFATKEDILKKDKSVISGITVQEMGENSNARIWNSNRGNNAETLQQPASLSVSELNKLIKQGKKSAMPQGLKPMKCELIHEPFDNEDWFYELKLDGYRIIATVNDDKVTLTTTEVQNYTKRYQIVADALKTSDHKIVLDGEVVVLNEEGKPDFQKLQNYKGTDNLVYYVFDLLWIDGYDIMHLPLTNRKRILQSVLPADPVIRYVDHIEEQGKAFFKLVQEQELEGWVAKHKESAYFPGRDSKSWLKLPNEVIREYVVVGWTESGSGNLYARLMYGEYRDDKLYYLHHTGSRPSKQVERATYNELKTLEVKKKPVVNTAEEETPIHWVKPIKVARFKFKSLKETLSGKPRHPVIFLGFREDKSAKNVTHEDVIEVEEAIADAEHESVKHPASKAKKTRSNIDTKGAWKKLHAEAITKIDAFDIDGKKFDLINSDQEYWLKGAIKADVLNYYAAMHEQVLYYLKDRPLGLSIVKKWAGETEFIRNAEGLYPGWVEVFQTKRRQKKAIKGDDIDWIICNDLPTLLYLVNLGALDLHPWAARKQKYEFPDYLVLDLDPYKRPNDQKTTKTREQDRKSLIKAALTTKAVLDELQLTAFIKTSGKNGLHIFIPCEGIKYGQARPLAFKLAQKIEKRIPKIATTESEVHHRKGKLYIDTVQNDFSDRIAVAYSIRAHKIPTVSTPLYWEEVNDSLDVKKFRFDNILQRLEVQGDPWQDLFDPKIKKSNTAILQQLI
jgi:bifunctional non-homologous end joining protein LigD